jgi:hypothetical protein
MEPEQRNPATAGELLDEVRAFYLKEFASAAAYLAEDGSEVWFEPAIRDEQGNLAYDGPLNLPMRADLISVRDGEPQDRLQVDTEAMLSFDAFSFEWPGGVELRLAPFQWEVCAVRAKCVKVPVDWSPLKRWFLKWFDTEDTNKPNPQGFFEVLHFMSEPTLQGQTLSVSVDLGTAPVEAFEELIDALRNIGAAEVEVGNENNGDV